MATTADAAIIALQNGWMPSTYTVPSRHIGNPPHTVTLVTSKRAGVCGPAGTLYVTCNCAGGRNAFANAALGRNSACHAMRAAASKYGAALPPTRGMRPALDADPDPAVIAAALGLPRDCGRQSGYIGNADDPCIRFIGHDGACMSLLVAYF